MPLLLLFLSHLLPELCPLLFRDARHRPLPHAQQTLLLMETRVHTTPPAGPTGERPWILSFLPSSLVRVPHRFPISLPPTPPWLPQIPLPSASLSQRALSTRPSSYPSRIIDHQAVIQSHSNHPNPPSVVRGPRSTTPAATRERSGADPRGRNDAAAPNAPATVIM